MADLTANVNVEMVWLREVASLSTCKACRERQFYTILRLWINTKVNGVAFPLDKTDHILCESCYELLTENS